jgi:hypothetical protein|tara:strand:+ start:98 stop:310 length:213 start_codon:yes stop_codon:yes gene_type:complete
MKTTTEDNTLSRELNADVQTKEKHKPNRPNIDHLIKRILTERRKQERKNLTVFMGILLIIGCTIMFSYYS